MRRSILFVFAFLLLPVRPASAAECRIGERVTLTVLMLANLAKTEGGWFYEGVSARPCTVSKILGKGRPPASCKDDAVLTATGTVEELLGPTLSVESVSCK
ncbi:MAG: hypothetical protein KGZ73_03695 [Rhizobiales bacterium]|nr:hypothetical protein [Hyphomicrobiales bacterium]